MGYGTCTLKYLTDAYIGTAGICNNPVLNIMVYPKHRWYEQIMIPEFSGMKFFEPEIFSKKFQFKFLITEKIQVPRLKTSRKVTSKFWNNISLKELSLSKSPIYMGRLFRIFKGVCWLGAQKRSEKIFKFFSPSFYMIIPLIPNHLIFTTWDTSIVVAPSKRNILTQTRVDIGSTQVRGFHMKQ